MRKTLIFEQKHAAPTPRRSIHHCSHLSFVFIYISRQGRVGDGTAHTVPRTQATPERTLTPTRSTRAAHTAGAACRPSAARGLLSDSEPGKSPRPSPPPPQTLTSPNAHDRTQGFASFNTSKRKTNTFSPLLVYASGITPAPERLTFATDKKSAHLSRTWPCFTVLPSFPAP